MRFSEADARELLSKNEGFKTSTSYDSENCSYVRVYGIKSGQLIIREFGHTNKINSQYDKTWVADSDEVLSFFGNNLKYLQK
jgi:uncharacterized protein YqkB